MRANSYQEQALGTAFDLPIDYFLGKLVPEVVELLDIYYKNMRDNDGEVQLTDLEILDMFDELGDCAWYIAVIAEKIGANFGDVLQYNLNKLAKRQEKGQLKRR